MRTDCDALDDARKDRMLVVFVIEHQEAHGSSPSLREIGAALGMTSTNGVRYWLNRCMANGWITKRPIVARGITVTALGRCEVGR